MSEPTPDRMRAGRSTHRPGPAGIALVAAAALSLAACLGTRRPLPVVTSYDLDYEPPAFAGRDPLEAVVEVGLVAVNDALGRTDMLYQPEPRNVNSYNYSQWVAPPPDLVGSLLVRDMARSGLFHAAFSYRDRMVERFLLFGTLEQFMEVDKGEKAMAAIGLTLALFDTRPSGPETRILLFQRHYEARADAREKSAGGLAASMSSAMRDISRAVIGDLHTELAAYLAGRAGSGP